MFLILLVYALFASTFTIGKDAICAVPPIFFIGIRMTLAGILLFLFMLIFKRDQIRMRKQEIGWFLGIIAFHIYGSYVPEYISLQYISSIKACLLYNMSPFVTALLAYFIFNDRLNLRKFLGLVIGFGAFMPTFMQHAGDPSGAYYVSFPEMLLLISVVSACLGWVFMKKLTHAHNHSYLFVNTIGMLFGGIGALITSWHVEIWPLGNELVNNHVFLRSLFGLILIGNVACYNLYGYLLHKYSPTLLSFFGFVTPLFAALFGWILLGESIEPSFFITMTFVVFGLYLFYKEDLKLKEIVQ